MIVPTAVPFTSLQPGTVYTTDNTSYWMVCSSTSAVNLANGAITDPVDPTLNVTPLPGAQLVLG